jgi:hypothetical protein
MSAEPLPQMPDHITFFAPERALLRDVPWPAGTVLRGDTGTIAVLVDRGGYAFLACCLTHETAGTARGWYVTRDGERIATRGWAPATPAEAARACTHDPANPFGIVAADETDA